MSYFESTFPRFAKPIYARSSKCAVRFFAIISPADNLQIPSPMASILQNYKIKIIYRRLRSRKTGKSSRIFWFCHAKLLPFRSPDLKITEPQYCHLPSSVQPKYSRANENTAQEDKSLLRTDIFPLSFLLIPPTIRQYRITKTKHSAYPAYKHLSSQHKYDISCIASSKLPLVGVAAEFFIHIVHRSAREAFPTVRPLSLILQMGCLGMT
jgi:hypothetical protein